MERLKTWDEDRGRILKIVNDTVKIDDKLRIKKFDEGHFSLSSILRQVADGDYKKLNELFNEGPLPSQYVVVDWRRAQRYRVELERLVEKYPQLKDLADNAFGSEIEKITGRFFEVEYGALRDNEWSVPIRLLALMKTLGLSKTELHAEWELKIK